MAFTETERVQIRRFLCYPQVYTPPTFREIEDKITRSQSNADGGVRVDSSAEAAIRGYLTNLALVEVRWLKLLTQMQVGKADEVGLDAVRGLSGIFRIGRLYIGNLSDALDTKPLRDFFTPRPPEESGGEDMRVNFG